jgi:hypothetical protein
MRRQHPVAVVATVLACVTAAGATAEASVGVAVRWGFLSIPRPLEPGKSYRLPLWGVRNPGTELTAYRMEANGVRGQQLLAPSSRWFRFSPSKATLAPGRERAVRITLVVPKKAKRGKYMALVKAAIAPRGTGAGVGAAAGARVLFSVGARHHGLRANTSNKSGR